MFVFVLLVFGFLSLRADQSARRIAKNAQAVEVVRKQTVIANCHGGAAIITRFNRLQQELIKLDQRSLALGTSTPAGEQIFKARIKIYTDNLLPVPDCSKLPKP